MNWLDFIMQEFNFSYERTMSFHNHSFLHKHELNKNNWKKEKEIRYSKRKQEYMVEIRQRRNNNKNLFPIGQDGYINQMMPLSSIINFRAKTTVSNETRNAFTCSNKSKLLTNLIS